MTVPLTTFGLSGDGQESRAYWLESFVKRNRRPATYALYETNIRLYLKPGLGSRKLARLSVADVQRFLGHRLEKGDSVRKVQIMRTVLSAALTRAVREELVPRNVARLAEVPEWRPKPVRPWTADEARHFMSASQSDPLHAAFVLLILFGLRRGEVLGLRWADIDFDAGIIHVRQQVQRIRGELRFGPVKTHAGQRNLPLLNLAHPHDHDSPRPAHGRLALEGPERPCPRCPDHPRPLPLGRDAGDLYSRR